MAKINRSYLYTGAAKAEHDAFLTDRYIYSLVIKFAQLLMRRQDSANKLMKFLILFGKPSIYRA